jgi:hypothetical protein
VGLNFDLEEITQTVADADKNGDGKIDYSEFASLWKEHVIQVQYTPLVRKLQRVRLLVRAARSLSPAKRLATAALDDELGGAASSSSSSPASSPVPSASILLANTTSAATDHDDGLGLYLPSMLAMPITPPPMAPVPMPGTPPPVMVDLPSLAVAGKGKGRARTRSSAGTGKQERPAKQQRTVVELLEEDADA